MKNNKNINHKDYYDIVDSKVDFKKLARIFIPVEKWWFIFGAIATVAFIILSFVYSALDNGNIFNVLWNKTILVLHLHLPFFPLFYTF